MKITSNFVALSALVSFSSNLINAAPTAQDELWNRASGAVTTSVKTTIADEYDYIIVGGGLTGEYAQNKEI